jgi:hypothetical protein
MIAQVIVTNLPDTTATDIAKVFSDFHVNVSMSSIVLGLICIKAAAGYIRNFALKNQTEESTGIIGRAIAHLAGNSLPSQPIVLDTKEPVVPKENPVVQTKAL